MCGTMDENFKKEPAEGWEKEHTGSLSDDHAQEQSEDWSEELSDEDHDLLLLLQKLLADGRVEDSMRVIRNKMYRHIRMEQYGITPSNVDDY